ncbi:MAG TPA: HEAT repeat domain-containing protein [Candidatus Methanoperedens sp.]|nr:HEAT repeat domain-containing protein [Candidatus Methanoperedens sp.]
MRRFASGPLLASLLLSAAMCVSAEAPPLAAGALIASGRGTGRFSLRAREVSPESLQLNLNAQTGLTVVAPGDAPVSVEFADLPAREAAAAIGAAIGGLVPLRASWTDSAPDARVPSVERYFLVRRGTRRQMLVDAYGLEQGGDAHRRLFDLLTGEGAAALPDVLAHARDATRSERERVLTIKLLGSLGAPAAVVPLADILRAGPGSMARQAAAIALGWTGLPAAVPVLRAALTERETDVALSAAWALVHLGDRAGVALALAQLRGQQALAALEVIAATGDPVHAPALEAALPELRGLARLRARTTLADLELARLDDGGKIAAGERLLADPLFEIRRHGAKTLEHLGTPAAQAALERVAADQSRTGAGEAAEAVARLRRTRLPQPEVVFE